MDEEMRSVLKKISGFFEAQSEQIRTLKRRIQHLEADMYGETEEETESERKYQEKRSMMIYDP